MRTPSKIAPLTACAITVVLAGCGAPPAAQERPAPTHRTSFDDSTAVAEARAELLRYCPAPTEVARPVIQDPDEGWVTELGTPEEAVAFLWASDQASAINIWARCTFPDSYAGFRVDEGRESGQPYGAVLSVTDAAGPDPLKGAPLGVLAGRVTVERKPYSYLEMSGLASRVQQALQACDATAASHASLVGDLDSFTISTPDGATVRACVEAADARGDLGHDPGGAQVAVVDTGSDESILDGPVIVKTGTLPMYNLSGAGGRVEFVDGCLLLVNDSPDSPDGTTASLLVWGRGTTWDPDAQEVVLEGGVRIAMGTEVMASGDSEDDLVHVLGAEGEQAARACDGVGRSELSGGGRAIRHGAWPVDVPHTFD